MSLCPLFPAALLCVLHYRSLPSEPSCFREDSADAGAVTSGRLLAALKAWGWSNTVRFRMTPRSPISWGSCFPRTFLAQHRRAIHPCAPPIPPQNTKQAKRCRADPDGIGRQAPEEHRALSTPTRAQTPPPPKDKRQGAAPAGIDAQLWTRWNAAPLRRQPSPCRKRLSTNGTGAPARNATWPPATGRTPRRLWSRVQERCLSATDPSRD